MDTPQAAFLDSTPENRRIWAFLETLQGRHAWGGHAKSVQTLIS